jgi:hypothetical protein
MAQGQVFSEYFGSPANNRTDHSTFIIIIIIITTTTTIHHPGLVQ